MRVVLQLLRHAPRRSGTVLACLLLAAALDVVGLSTLLPLLSLAAARLPDAAAAAPSPLEQAVGTALARLGLTPSLPVLLGAIAAALWCKAGIELVANREVGYAVARVATDLRLRVLRALLAARWSHFTRQPLGEVANALASEAGRAAEAYRHAALVASFSLEAAAYAAVALAISWPATLAAAGAAALTLAALSSLVRASARAGRDQTDRSRSLLARVSDALHAARLLKATAQERALAPLLETETRALEVALRRRVLSREALRALQEPLLATLGLAGLVAAFAWLRLPLPEVTVLVLIFARLLARVGSVQTKLQLMVTESSALASLDALARRAEAARESAGEGGLVPTLARGIELCDVRVEQGGRAVLEGLCLEIPADRVTAVVGASGAGKTTLTDLVTGLVEPDAGEVRIDGVPFAKLDRRRWRERIGYVPQETLLLHDTVRANVTLGDPDLAPDAVERALRDAGAWEFVSALPGGLEAPVGERGALLSGGQRQRLAIARALVRAPRLLVLDEATSGLDAESERAIWETVARLRGRTGVLAISHRPALARVADRVYRLEGGRAVREPARAVA